MLSVVLTRNSACHCTNQKKHLQLQVACSCFALCAVICAASSGVPLSVHQSRVHLSLVYLSTSLSTQPACVQPMWLGLLTLAVCFVVIGLVSDPHYRTLYASLPMGHSLSQLVVHHTAGPFVHQRSSPPVLQPICLLHQQSLCFPAICSCLDLASSSFHDVCEIPRSCPLTLDVMWVVLEVWQAILVKKLDLDSSWVKQSMSEGARNLLKVSPLPPLPPVAPLFLLFLLLFCLLSVFLGCVSLCFSACQAGCW